MKTSNHSTFPPVLIRQLAHSQRWTWGVVVLSILVCAVIAWLHFQQRQTLDQAAQTLDSMRQAQIELAEGFLHLSLAGDPASPFDREQGLALLEQAISSFDTIAAGLEQPEQSIQAFRADVGRFRDRLVEWRNTASPTAAVETELRIAFDRLEGQADHLDEATRHSLRALSNRLDALYAWTLSGAVVLLAGICGAVFLAGRARHAAEVERRRAEESLRESESRFRQLVEFLPQLVWTCTPAGVCDFLSRPWVEYTGIPAAEQLGFGWLEQLHPDDREPTVAAWNAAVATRSDFHVEFRIRRHDGVYRWFDTRAVRLLDAEGHTVKWFGSNTDIDEAREMREALWESEERLAFALEVSQIGVWDLDLVDHTAHRSLQHGRIFGYETLLPGWTYEKFLEHVIPEERANVDDLISQAIAARSDWSIECRIHRCDGEIRWIWVTGRHRRDHHGNPLKIVGGIVQDITERKRTEAALQIAFQRFQIILSSLYGGILVMSSDSRVEFANQAFCDLFDLDDLPEDLLGLYAPEVIQKIANVYAGPPEALARIQEILANGQPVRGEEIAITGERTYIRDFIPIVIDGKQYGRLWHHLDITELKQAEDALRLSKERLGLALEAAHAGAWEWNLRTNENVWSEELWQVYGLEPHSCQPSYEAWRQTVHPADRATAEQVVQAAAGSGAELNAEWRVKAGDGTERWLMSRGRPWRDANGQVVRFIGIVLDITERKRAETTLRELAENMAAAQQIAHFGSWEVKLTAESEFIEPFLWSDECYCIFGFEPGSVELTSAVILNRLHPDDREPALRAALKGMQERTGHSSEYRLRLPNGSIRYVHEQAKIILDERTGQSVKLIGTVHDITERKQVEEQLSKIADTAPGGLCSFQLRPDGATCLPYVSAAWEEIHGLKGEEVKQDAAILFQLIHPDDIERVNQTIAESARSMSPWREEYRLLNPQKGEIWVEGHSTPVLEPDGSILWYGFITNITERKRAEEELRRTAAELTRSNTELQQFAYIASHDLQEPLRAVGGMLQLLQVRYAGQLDARADEFIQYAVDGAARMQTLINDLLTFSRIATRGQPFQPTDCTTMVQNVLANLAVAIQESGAVITYDPLPTLLADPSQLSQLFQNLIANAIKFQGDDTPVVHIGVAQKEGEWLFSIHDNGIGIEAEYFERIFVIFQRLHTRREYPGTGIGLAVCKKIVERHGGRMWIESELGQGSTFYFTLPDRSCPKSGTHCRE